MHDRELIHRVATMYYLQEETMDSIASCLGVSRSTVSRLLSAARDTGVVTITVNPLGGMQSVLAQRLRDRFKVAVHIVPVRRPVAPSHRLEHVARFAAQTLAGWFGDDMILGIAWGTTLSAIVHQLPKKSTTGSLIVQLNGAASTRSSGVLYAGEILTAAAVAFDAAAAHFPTPAFFDYPLTKEVLWRERSVRRVLDLQRRCDIVVFGVGALDGEVPSHVYTSGFLDNQDMADLRDNGVVGDVCTVFLREDGSWQDIAMNARSSGPTPHDMAGVPRRVCVVAEAARVPATIGALRAGFVTDLIIDEATARVLDDASAGVRRRLRG